MTNDIFILINNRRIIETENLYRAENSLQT